MKCVSLTDANGNLVNLKTIDTQVFDSKGKSVADNLASKADKNHTHSASDIGIEKIDVSGNTTTFDIAGVLKGAIVKGYIGSVEYNKINVTTITLPSSFFSSIPVATSVTFDSTQMAGNMGGSGLEYYVVVVNKNTVRLYTRLNDMDDPYINVPYKILLLNI